MSNFMEGYEDVAARVKRWQVAFPVGRIETDVVWHDAAKSQVLVKASVYREHEDTLAAAIDWAFGDSTNYPTNMRKWYLEDTVTSAIGRAISLVLETEKKPTSQDMAKVEYVTNKPFKDKLEDKIIVPNADDVWTTHPTEAPKTSEEAVNLVKSIIGGQTEKDIPKCRKCDVPKVMMWKTGVSGKTNKAWGKFDCFACKDLMWYEIKPDGSWGAQESRF